MLGNVRRSLREPFFYDVGAVLGCRLLREVANLAGRQRGRARSRNLRSECRHCEGFLFMFGAHLRGGSTLSPFIQGRSDRAHVNVAWEMGRALSIVRDDQSVTAGDTCIIAILLLFFSPFLSAWLCLQVSEKWTTEIKPGLLFLCPPLV